MGLFIVTCGGHCLCIVVAIKYIFTDDILYLPTLALFMCNTSTSVRIHWGGGTWVLSSSTYVNDLCSSTVKPAYSEVSIICCKHEFIITVFHSVLWSLCTLPLG